MIESERPTIDSSRSGDDIGKLASTPRHQQNSRLCRHADARGPAGRDGTISLAGALPFMTSFSVDGISTQRVRYGGPSRELFPSVESIEEFKVTTATNSAEFMQVSDLTTTTRSGSNQLHGTGFWFNQDSALSATSRFTPRDAGGNPIKPDIKANSFGVSGGGPIVRNRAFFFGTYEGARRPNEVTLSQVVPPDAWRSGDLSSVAGPLRDPFTGQPFSNNRIPVNPVSARLLDSFYERQNQPTGTAINAPNFIVNAPGDYTVDGFDGRVDYALSTGQKMFGRFTWKNVDDRSPSAADWNTTQGDHFRRTEVRQIAASHNWIRRAFINELRGGWSNTVEKDSYTNASRGADLVAAAGLVGLPGAPVTGGFPHLEFADGSFISTGGVKPFNILSRVVQGTDTMTWLAGRHSVKAGADIQYVEYRDQISFFDGEELGRYVFHGSFTGNGFADFLLGSPHHRLYPPAPDEIRSPRITRSSAGYLAANAQRDRRLRSALQQTGPPMNDRATSCQLRRDLSGGR